MTAIITQTIDNNNSLITELAIRSDSGQYLQTSYPNSLDDALNIIASTPEIQAVEYETI